MKYFKFKATKDIFAANLLFIFVFLNLWDLAISHRIFNAMAIGVFIFSGPAVLWLIGKLWAIAIVTLVSFMEVLIIAVMLLQGIQISGADITLKTIFFAPFLVMACINMVLGLRFYTKGRKAVSV